MLAYITVAPDNIEPIGKVVEEIAEAMAKGDSITQDELDRAKKPLIVSIEQTKRKNSYWVSSVLQACQEYPQRLDWSRSFIEDYKAVTLEDVNALAKEFLQTKDRVMVTIIPTAPAKVCLLYTSPSPRDRTRSRMPSSA